MRLWVFFFVVLGLSGLVFQSNAHGQIVDFRQDNVASFFFGDFVGNHSFDSNGLIFDITSPNPVGAINITPSTQVNLNDIDRIEVTAFVGSGNLDDLFFFVDEDGTSERFVYSIPADQFVENTFTTVSIATTDEFATIFPGNGVLDGNLINVGFAPPPIGQSLGRTHFAVQSLAFVAVPEPNSILLIFALTNLVVIRRTRRI